MSRKLRTLSAADVGKLCSCCAGCVFWESAEKLDRSCGQRCDVEQVREWVRRVNSEWGECGKVVFEDDEVLGFIKYAPSGYFPQAANFSAAPEDPKVPLIACMHVSPDARHHGLGSLLLRACIRDLAGRGERKIEAFGIVNPPAAIDESPMVSMEFLLRNGFTVSRPDPMYPLLKLDVRSLAVWTDNLEAVLESLRFPPRAPKRVPASWMNGR
jgi:GNAT superfamily N-acetyltransferase